jgi:palmitoyl transferase
MKLTRIIFFCCCFPLTVFADESLPCEHWPALLKPICLRPYQTWTQGKNELYVSGYAWHNRHYYDRERLSHYNEAALGGGLGKSFYDEKGDWHGLYAIGFLDSHKNIEPTVGYAFLKVLHMTENLRAGLGYTVLVTQRPDIFKGIPFPGALPWMSINYSHFSISGTYIPGSKNVGNVMFILTKWVF